MERAGNGDTLVPRRSGREGSPSPLKEPARELVSQAEFARRRGVSRQAVHQAVLSGRVKLISGKVDVAAANEAWETETNLARPKNSVTGDPKMGRQPNGNGNGHHDPPADTGAAATPRGRRQVGTYLENRASLDFWKSELARLEFQKQEGLLIEAADVEKATLAAYQKVRDSLLMMPERLFSVLAGEEDPAKILHILDTEVRLALEELSNEFGE